MCFYPFVLVYHWLSTINCKPVAIPDCLLPWHDCHLDVQWNTIAAWAKIHTGFPVTPNQWKRERLNSEKFLEHPGIFVSPNLGNVSHKPWSVVVELHWGCVWIHDVTFPSPFYKFWLYCPVFWYMSMFDLLNTNGVSDYWYENNLKLIKALYWCMSEYVPTLVRNVLKLLYMIQVFIPKLEYLPVSVKYATQLLWNAKNGHIS